MLRTDNGQTRNPKTLATHLREYFEIWKLNRARMTSFENLKLIYVSCVTTVSLLLEFEIWNRKYAKDKVPSNYVTTYDNDFSWCDSIVTSLLQNQGRILHLCSVVRISLFICINSTLHAVKDLKKGLSLDHTIDLSRREDIFQTTHWSLLAGTTSTQLWCQPADCFAAKTTTMPMTVLPE